MGAESTDLAARQKRAAGRLVQRLDELGRISDQRGKLTRTFLSPAMRRANSRVGKWMQAAGLRVTEDATGNLIGRIGSARETLLIGSHLDTVRDAGRFDGALGVLTGIAALEALGTEEVRRLPFSVVVVGFAEEEGVRFASAYLGSKGFFGALDAADLGRMDNLGLTVGSALARFKPRSADDAWRRPPRWAGYLEVHIEQGPALEKARSPVGVVTAIAGQTRGRAVFTGRAGHAGTTPMGLRRDALAGAAEWIVSVERSAFRVPGLVATVGTIQAEPGAPNVISGRVQLSLDIRHADDRRRRRNLQRMVAKGRAIARRRGLRFAWTVTQNNGAVACDRHLTSVLAAAVKRVAPGSCPRLVSGAGHDAVVAARMAPVAMLFVRCRAGLSHHPGEYAAPRDIEAGLRVTCAFLRQLAQR